MLTIAVFSLSTQKTAARSKNFKDLKLSLLSEKKKSKREKRTRHQLKYVCSNISHTLCFCNYFYYRHQKRNTFYHICAFSCIFKLILYDFFLNSFSPAPFSCAQAVVAFPSNKYFDFMEAENYFVCVSCAPKSQVYVCARARGVIVVQFQLFINRCGGSSVIVSLCGVCVSVRIYLFAECHVACSSCAHKFITQRV